MSPNLRDSYNATPLHFAVLKLELMNVQLLLKYGADVNAQDKLGQSPLHLAIVKLADDVDDFDNVKRIIKELLFGGANRSLKTEA